MFDVSVRVQVAAFGRRIPGSSLTYQGPATPQGCPGSESGAHRLRKKIRAEAKKPGPTRIRQTPAKKRSSSCF